MNAVYKDPKKPTAERVRDLLSRMTLDEKIAQLHAFWLVLSEDGQHRPRQDGFTGGSDAEQMRSRLKNGPDVPRRHAVPLRAVVRRHLEPRAD